MCVRNWKNATEYICMQNLVTLIVIFYIYVWKRPALTHAKPGSAYKVKKIGLRGRLWFLELSILQKNSNLKFQENVYANL